MPCSLSLAEACYLAYWRRWPALPLPWHRLTKRERAAWAAAAQEAIAAWQAPQGDHASRNGHRPPPR